AAGRARATAGVEDPRLAAEVRGEHGLEERAGRGVPPVRSLRGGHAPVFVDLHRLPEAGYDPAPAVTPPRVPAEVQRPKASSRRSRMSCTQSQATSRSDSATRRKRKNWERPNGRG